MSNDDVARVTDSPAKPFIEEGAQRLRLNVLNPTTNEAIGVRLLSSDIEPKTAASFFSRVFSRELISANRTQFKNRLKNHFTRLLGEDFDPTRETPTDAARRRNQERAAEGEETDEDPTGEAESAEGPSPQEIADEIRQGIRNPITGEVLELPDNMDLDELAEQVTQTIEGSSATRTDLPQLPQGPRGTLQERTLNIPDDDVLDFLETDPRLVMRKFLNTIIPDTELQREFFFPEVEPGTRAGRQTPQEREAEREEALREPRAELAQARSDLAEASRQLVQSMTDEQDQAFRQIRQNIAANRERIPDQTANQIMDRLRADPLLAFDRGLVQHIRSLGLERVADNVAEIQNGRRIRADQQEIRAEIERARAREADAGARFRQALNTVGEGVQADNRLGDLENQLADQITREADQIIRNAETADEAAQIARERDQEIAMLQASIARIRGTAGNSKDPRTAGLRTGLQAARELNFARLLGSVVLSSIPDAGKVVMEEGFTRSHGAILAEFTNGLDNGLASARKDAETFAIGIDRTINEVAEQRFLGGEDTDEGISRVSPGPVERMQKRTRQASNFMARASGLNLWNSTLQRIASRAITDRILRTIDKVNEGGMESLSRRERAKLVRSMASEHMAQRIADQARRFGTEEGGLRTAGIQQWTDAGAANALADAVRRDVDNTIINPGVGDTPLWATTELGRAVAQFKRFAFATTNRILISGMQRRDAQVFQGLSMMLALGGASVALRDIAKDGTVQERSERQWAVSAIDRSGIGFLLFEMDSIVDKTSGGNVSLQRALAGEELQRFTTRGPLSQIGGPTVGLLESSLPSGFDAISETLGDGTFTDDDAKDLLRLLPGQNHFAVRALLDEATRATFPDEEPQ